MSDKAYPNNELIKLIEDQRRDTSDWQNTENHSPNPNIDPYSLDVDDDMPGVDRTMETQVTAKVFVSNIDNIEGGKVLLSSGDFHVVGKVVVDAEDAFSVEWRTGRNSIEKKANYDLVVVANEDEAQFGCRKCGEGFPQWTEDSLCENCAGDRSPEEK